MSDERLADLLAKTPLARDLGEDDLQRLAESGEVREAARGDVLLEQGTEDAPLFVVLDGEVEVLMTDAEGRHHCLLNLGETSVLGEIGLVLGRPVTASVRTTRDSTLFVLERRRFEGILEGGGKTAAALALSLARVLAARLQRMNEEAVKLCERYEEALAQPGTPASNARVAELARFKQQLLSEWNF